MRYYRAELVYDITREQRDRGDYPDRHIPRALRLIDEDENAIEIKGVRQASISYGLSDARVLNLSIIVRGVDEVYADDPAPLLQGDASDEDAVFLGRTEATVDLPEPNPQEENP